MRQLVLLRGAQGSGKSTWIKNNGLEDYALSADTIRLMMRSPILKEDGSKTIDQSINKEVWELLFDILEKRMSNGDFVVIDACNSKTVEMSKYKALADKYKYRVFVVDFTDVPVETAIDRNKNRKPDYKFVPEDIIQNYYSRFSTQGVPGGFKVIKPEKFREEVFLKLFDFNKYEKIYIIGDIHGCNTCLQEMMARIAPNGFEDNNFYIFTGDLLDRGIENVEVLKYFLSIYNRKNILILEGNHEQHILNWANCAKASSKEFALRTQKQLNESDIDKKAVRVFLRTLGQCAYFEYGGKKFFVSHGGVPKVDALISTQQIIKGVGDYEDVVQIAESWSKNEDCDSFQVFGHRNVNDYAIDGLKSNRTYVLEGGVEFGGCLRAIEISKCGENVNISPISIKNNVYNKMFNKPTYDEIKAVNIESFIDIARASKFIEEVKFDNISSFNFSRDAFNNGEWNELTVRARGLFIDTKNNKIVARGYNKFFNVNERIEDTTVTLSKTLKFPVQVTLKENGFLGILSVHEDEFFFATKKTINGEHVRYFKDIFHSLLSDDDKEYLKSYIKENDVTFLFEVIDPINDPHIIKYNFKKLVLLDIVKNSLNFEKAPQGEIERLGMIHNYHHKVNVKTIKNYDEFLEIVDRANDYNYTYRDNPIEGYVFRDSNGYMVKLKTCYYNTWKHLRAISNEVYKKGYSDKTSSLLTPIENEFYAFLRNKLSSCKNQDERLAMKTNIINDRDEFLNNVWNKHG